MNKCNNCGKSWHVYKQCKLPIVSIGLINVNEKKEYLMIPKKINARAMVISPTIIKKAFSILSSVK